MIVGQRGQPGGEPGWATHGPVVPGREPQRLVEHGLQRVRRGRLGIAVEEPAARQRARAPRRRRGADEPDVFSRCSQHHRTKWASARH